MRKSSSVIVFLVFASALFLMMTVPLHVFLPELADEETELSYHSESDHETPVTPTNSKAMSASESPSDTTPEPRPLQGVEKIAFISDRNGNMDIWIMNADGGNNIQLTKDPSEDLFQDWSPNAEKIAFATAFPQRGQAYK